MLISDHVYRLLEYEGVVRDVGKIVASTVQDQNTPEGPKELNQEYYIASKKHEQLESRMKLIEAKVETQAAAAVEKMSLENDTKVVEMKHEIKKIHDQQVVNNAKNSEIINLLKVLEENRLRDATLVKQIMGIVDSQSDK